MLFLKGKGKVGPAHTIKASGRVDIQLCSFPSSLEGVSGDLHAPTSICCETRSPSTLWIGGWVSRSARLVVLEK